MKSHPTKPANAADARRAGARHFQGSAHIQIKSMDVTGPDSPEAYLKGLQPIYLLPRQQREWVIDDERARAALRIKVAAVTDAGALHETIDITR